MLYLVGAEVYGLSSTNTSEVCYDQEGRYMARGARGLELCKFQQRRLSILEHQNLSARVGLDETNLQTLRVRISNRVDSGCSEMHCENIREKA